MARKRKTVEEPKRPRVRRPRSERTPRDTGPKDDGGQWLIRASARMAANQILNAYPERPYWLSIPHGPGDGVEPVAGYFPCSYFRTKTRVYYGFLFREHREAVMAKWDNARREFLETVQSIKRS